jgi:hypothetical protein
MRAMRRAWVPLVLLSVACTETVDSDEVRTGGVYPEIEVTADGSGDSTVKVNLKVGGVLSNTYLELRGDDTLEVSAGDKTKELRESDDGYTTVFPVDGEATEFTIAFLRGDDDESAPASTVELPAPFKLSVKDKEASRKSDDVSFSWTPAGDDNISWHIEGDCIQSNDGVTPDDGTGTIAADNFVEIEQFKDESCGVTLALTRTTTGRLDSAFEKGGEIVAHQVRKKSFTSKP